MKQIAKPKSKGETDMLTVKNKQSSLKEIVRAMTITQRQYWIAMKELKSQMSY